MSRISKQEQEAARIMLRGVVKPGDTLYTVLRHVSRSGMSRGIDVYALTCEGGKADRRWLSRLVSKAVGIPFDENRECLKVGGCGMDMGFHVVYELGYALFGNEWTCTGEGCPSNAHNNGDRDHTPHQHRDGGYALSHKWL